MDLSRIARRFHRYQAPIGWVLVGFLIPVFTDLVSSWLKITWGPLIPLAWAAGIVVALGAVYVGVSRAGKFRPALVPEEKQAPRFAGLIQLVGPGKRGKDPLEGSNIPAIEWHLRPNGEVSPLQVCWLIASEAGKPVAEMLRERFEGRCQVEIREIWNHLNLYETYQVVRHIYEQEAAERGLAPEDIVADFTAGHKMMSAGMILACRDRWPMQYVSGGAEVGAESIPILVRFEEPE